MSLLVVEIPFGVRAVEATQACASNVVAWHKPRVHSHPVDGFIDGGPMSDTTATSATMKFDGAVVPHINIGGGIDRDQVDQSGRIISPEHAIAAADRAIAVGHLGWSDIAHQADRAAVAGGLGHVGGPHLTLRHRVVPPSAASAMRRVAICTIG
jgi:hypothetical protein